MSPSHHQRAAIVMMAAASLAVTGCATGRAYSDAIVTDRPDFTESPVAVPEGALQLEMGNTYDRTDGVEANTVGEVLMRVGMRRGAELRVGVPSYVHVRGPGGATGFGDAYLGAKLDLIRERQQPGLVPTTALIVGAGLPTGASAFRARGASPEAKLLLGWSLAERWALSSNLNYSSSDAGAGRVHEAAATLSVGHELTDRAGLYTEWFGFQPSVGAASHYANAGVTYQLTPNQQLDVRAGTGLGAARRDYFLGLGVSRRW